MSTTGVLSRLSYSKCICDNGRRCTCSRHADSRTGTEVFAVVADGALYVVFRGTDQWRDWAFNLRSSLAPWGGPGRVHRGVLAKYNSVRPWVLARARSHGGPLRATGHSVGGALACLFAADPCLQDRGVEVTTFGAPKVGDAAFALGAERVAPGAVRVASPLDPVPRFPLRCGYAHFGTPVRVWFLGHRAELYERAAAGGGS